MKSAIFAKGSNGRPTFLNVGNAFPNPNRFTVVIWGDDRNNFPGSPERTYKGAFICVRGRITLYQGVPQTFANRPNDIDTKGGVSGSARPEAPADRPVRELVSA